MCVLKVESVTREMLRGRSDVICHFWCINVHVPPHGKCLAMTMTRYLESRFRLIKKRLIVLKSLPSSEGAVVAPMVHALRWTQLPFDYKSLHLHRP